MQNNNQLLETLAQNLGTTVEYLWGVLLKQAPISATLDLITIILFMAYFYGLYRLHRYYSKPIGDDRYYSDRNLYDREDYTIAVMVIGCIVAAILLICTLCMISGIINGYFNPEYWALKEILNSVNQ